MKIEIVSAPETPIDKAPIHLSSCGTQHRGCDPQCPKRWYTKGRHDVAAWVLTEHDLMADALEVE